MDMLRRIRLDINQAMAATEGSAEAHRRLMNALDSLISLESFFVDYLEMIDEDDDMDS
ncbi:MAG: hypothetical protein QOI71_1842 [Gaiellales bacterium]|jgi:hypothetical protein|nr:hypothetical protein [Gaiellales bacterium]MDX6618047.1 hypothetical protein [Gaiellales bacterium]